MHQERTGGWLIPFWERRSDLLTTVMLATATLLTAWAAFQSAKWSGVQAIAFSDAGANRTESTRASTTAGQQATVDVNTFLAWLETATVISEEPAFRDDGGISPELVARVTEGPGLPAFLFQRFRDEFKPAVQAWLDTSPFSNPDAPASPFEMDEYQLALQVEADRLRQAAEVRASDARDANQQSDNYVILTVLFASVLFFAGLSMKMRAHWSQISIFALGILLLLVAVVSLLRQPIEFSESFL